MYADGMLSSEEYLVHFGILGMKWGVRRYQNPDGTLTAEGKLRYQNDNGTLTAEGRELVKKYGRPYEDTSDKRRSDEIAKSGVINNTIKKGSSLYRMSGPDEKLSDRRIYVSITDRDRKQYETDSWEGKLGLSVDDLSNATEYEYKATKDIKIATAKEQADYIFEKYGDVTLNELWSNTKNKGDADTFVTKYGETTLKMLKNDMDFLRENDAAFDTGYGYGTYSKAPAEERMVSKYARSMYLNRERLLYQTLFGKDKNSGDSMLTKRHYDMQDHFSKLGYQALVDLEDYGYTDLPLIILNPQSALKTVNKRNVMN